MPTQDYNKLNDEELGFEYFCKFGEFFPSIGFQGDERKMIIACLESGKKYKPDIPNGAII